MRSTLVAISLAVALAASCTASPQPAESSSPAAMVPVVQPGQGAPDFTLPQAIGTPVTLSDLRGRSVLLYFSMGPG